MRIQGTTAIVLGLVALSEASPFAGENFLFRREPIALAQQNKGGNGGNGGNANANANANNGANAAAAGGASETCLAAKAVQTGSQSDGNQVPADGQAASATDNANFINFCNGQTLTNGLQTKTGSCNGIVMGKIPATTNMVSSIIVNPAPAQNIAANTDFDVQVQTSGLAAGTFTNAAATYYSAPQNLNGQGQIIGHTHVTIQDLGKSLAPQVAPDPVSFAFFKGINDAGNGKGLLSATVTGGLPAGNYRVCTMSSSANHQPVLMPVAQRGAQDDCQKFTVGGGNGGNGGNANANNGGNANANGGNANANANANGGKAAASSAAGGNGNAGNGKAAAATSATSAAAAASTGGQKQGQGQGQGGFGGFGGGKNGKGRKARRFIH